MAHTLLKKPVARDLTDSDLSTLQNICTVAAERYRENAQTLHALAAEATPPGGSVVATGTQAARLAAQFERQEQEARTFATLFGDAFPFTVLIQPDIEAEE